MKQNCLLLLLFVTSLCAVAQPTFLEDSLKKDLANAHTVPDKMRLMYELGEHYIGLDNKLADDYGAQIISLGDSSRNREWMTMALLYNARLYYTFSQLQQNISKGIEFSQKALDMARASNLNELTAWSYLYLARGAYRNGENDKALNYNNMALAQATDIENDSLKTNVLNVLGDIYLAKNEKLLAFRNYLQALDLAEESGKYILLRETYSSMARFYGSLEDYEKAKDYEFKKEALQIKHHKPYDRLKTYNSLGTLYVASKQYDQALKYYEKSIALAGQIRYEPGKLSGYLNIVNLHITSGQYEKGLNYFHTHTELNTFFKNAGLGFFIDQANGAMYVFMNKLDSAEYYLKKAEPAMLQSVNKWSKYWFYSQLGELYLRKKELDVAINYHLQAKTMMEQLGNLAYLQYTSLELDSLYQQKGDFKSAYLYHSQATHYKDSLQKLSKEKDLLSMEIDNENRRKEREAKREELATQRRHNIQYMGITVCIAAVFILLVMAGVFSVSKTTIRIIGFFAFILLFEFIIMIADTKIHHATHGEPWKVLGIKIALIAILLPLHHWLEEKAIHYLTTQELLRIRGKGLMGKWFRKKDADVPMSNV